MGLKLYQNWVCVCVHSSQKRSHRFHQRGLWLKMLRTMNISVDICHFSAGNNKTEPLGTYLKKKWKCQLGKWTFLCSLRYYLQQPRHDNKLSIQWQINRENVAYIHNVILFSHKKEWNFAFSDNMDGPRGHCEQWNKWSETE